MDWKPVCCEDLAGLKCRPWQRQPSETCDRTCVVVRHKNVQADRTMVELGRAGDDPVHSSQALRTHVPGICNKNHWKMRLAKPCHTRIHSPAQSEQSGAAVVATATIRVCPHCPNNLGGSPCSTPYLFSIYLAKRCEKISKQSKHQLVSNSLLGDL